MIRFVNDPSSMREFFVTQSASKQAASDLIVEYAKYLQGNEHMYDVHSYMQLPDDADNLLLG